MGAEQDRGGLSPTGGRDVHTVRFPVGAPPDSVDVLVVGAGPVGLAAAVELTARGVEVAVVDRARTATLVRAGAMGHTARVVEHFRRWGLLRRIRDAWTYPPEWNQGLRWVTSLAGHELVPAARPSFTGGARGGAGAGEALRRPQTVLQRVFLEHLEEQRVSVAGSWELVGLREDADGVEAEVVGVDSGQRRTVRAGYVLGTDGARSTTRRLAGIGRTGAYATEKRLRLIVRTGDLSGRVGPAPNATNIVVNPTASGFLAAVSTRRLAWRGVAPGRRRGGARPGDRAAPRPGARRRAADRPSGGGVSVPAPPAPTPHAPPRPRPRPSSSPTVRTAGAPT